MEQYLSKNERERLERIKVSRARKLKKLLLWLVILAVIAGGIFGLVQYQEKLKSRKPGEEIPIASAMHIPEGQKSADFNSNPPTSGQHYAQTAPWGIHDEPIVDEHLVHNLEHGGIWISYQPDLASEESEEIEKLKDIADDYTLKVIMTPRPENDSPIAVAAWGRLLKLAEADRDQIIDFIRAYINKGPEDVPY